MQSVINLKPPVIMGFFIGALCLFLMGCGSSRKEELHQNLEVGEELLQEEKFDEAHTHYVHLLEEFQDNLTIMEKIDYSKLMKDSRENLGQAKEALDNEDYKATVTFLKEIPSQDEKALKEKEGILQEIKTSFLERAEQYQSDGSYEIALTLLEEYQEILGEDPDITEKMEKILVEKEKPEEKPKKVIVIDAAHQKNPNMDQEPIAPNSNVMRVKTSPGIMGVETKIPEYEVNLSLAKEMERVLVEGGYVVYLTRHFNDVNLGNIKRSEFAYEKQADLFIRLHGNSSKDKAKQGIQIYYPSKENTHVGEFSEASEKVSFKIYSEVVKSTNIDGQGVISAVNMPEHNFSKSPVITLLYGYLTNPNEDQRLQTKEYQNMLAKGFKLGIDDYFKEVNNN